MSNHQDITCNSTTVLTTLMVNGTISNAAMTNAATMAFFPDCDVYGAYLETEFGFWSDCRFGRIGQLGWDNYVPSSFFALQHFKSDTGMISADPASGLLTVNPGGGGTFMLTATLMVHSDDDCYQPVVPQALLLKNPYPYATTLTANAAITDAVINVASTDGYPTGTYRRYFYLQLDNGSYAKIHYTGTTATSFTGCTLEYGDGSASAGNTIVPYNIIEDYDAILASNGSNMDGYLEIEGNEDRERKELTLSTTCQLSGGDTVGLFLSYPYIDCSPIYINKVYSVSFSAVRLA